MGLLESRCGRGAAAALFFVLASTAHAATSVARCDGPFETVLTPTPALPAGFDEARAAWLDGHRLRWAGVAPAGGDFALVHASRSGLQLKAGQAVRGADNVLALQPVSTPAGHSDDSDATRRFSAIGEGVTLEVHAADRARLRQLHRGQLMIVQRDANGRVQAATSAQHAGALDHLFAGAERVPDLGVRIERNIATTFKLWAPTAQQVALCVHRPKSQSPARLLPMQREAGTGVWRVRVPRDLRGGYYTYAVDVIVRGRGLVRNRITDPYSLSLNADSQRSYIADLADPALAPTGWHATQRPMRVAAPTDLVVYELHVRDFSIGDASVPAALRGRYGAFTQAGSLGMQHLQRLSEAGVTDVHLLPVFDIATVPERGCATPTVPPATPDSPAQQAAVMALADRDCFNWGYDPWHFTAPEGSYASDANDGAVRIRELRAMVQALHRAGLRVGMDMVYNHTSASGQDAKSVLDRAVPGYYHRLDATGRVERSTCCDNTATEHRMMAKLMIDSAVDAAAGRRIHLLGEGWNFGEVADGRRFVQASQRSLGGSGIATFSDRARDAVRGGWGGGPDELARQQGLGNGLHLERNAAALAAGVGTADELARAADLVRVGLAGTLASYRFTTADGTRRRSDAVDYNGQPAGYAREPGETVNYVENHDNPTLFDNNVVKLPLATSREDRARMQHLAAAVVAFSQGIAYFHAGQEILRSKSLDRNSYDSGDWFNRLDWTLQDNGFGAGLPPEKENASHWDLMRPLLAATATIKPTPQDIRWTRDAFIDLLRIRASTPLLRLRTAAEIERRLSFPSAGPEQNAAVVAGHLDGQALRGAGFSALMYFINASPLPQRLALVAQRGARWVLHPVHRAEGAADRRAASAVYTPADGAFEIPARSAVVFVRE